jgi:aldehyde:ferredoxin oxidoreductase
LVICILGNVPPNDLASIVNKSTGYERTLDDLLLVGERGWTLKRIINNRLGLTRKNDRLPDPLLEPLEDGGAAGSKLDLEPMLREYYQKRGWDWLSGYPTREKIRDLNLDFSAKDLWPDS